MTQKPRAVRFSEAEEKAITDFLAINSFLDFSTLARLSIIAFMENPEIKLKPISVNTNKEKIKNENLRTH